jgi:hypothetical protein
MAERVPCIGIDGTEGNMNSLAESSCLVKLLAKHNNPADGFHIDEHQVVQVSHQFKHGGTFMTHCQFGIQDCPRQLTGIQCDVCRFVCYVQYGALMWE